MSVYDARGNPLLTVYGKNGTALSQCYDKSGTALIDDESDYDIYENEYQHTILTARNAWSTKYRQDSENIVPFVLTTDQHRHLNATQGKKLYDYLAKAVKWSEVSASMNLGDTCGAVYNTGDLNAMLSSFANIPKAKSISVPGNHDVMAPKAEGSTYAYGTINAETFATLHSKYFDNSSYNGYSAFDTRGNEVLIDEAHKVKYVIVSAWYFGNTNVTSEEGEPYYWYLYPTSAWTWLLSTLSAVDDYDIVILSHVQSLMGTYRRYRPAVDGDDWVVSLQRLVQNQCTIYGIGLDDVFTARKNKTSGTITDYYGVTHSYDFSDCTSDLLCCLSGHAHGDYLSVFANSVPSYTFDAYGYDNHPFYFGNIDRENQLIELWKVDDANHIYHVEIPFEERYIPCTGLALDKTEVTLAVGEEVNLYPIISTEFENDGTYPVWRVSSWGTRVGATVSSAIAQASGYYDSSHPSGYAIVTAKQPGACTVHCSCGGYSAVCAVTVTE